MTRQRRRVGAWLAVVGLLLQAGLGAAHSARHFDHLVGHPFLAAAVAASELSADPGCPSPATPGSPDLDHCAIGLGLAAAGNGVLPTAGTVPLPPARESAGLDGRRPALAAASPRHFVPPARAPPVVAISA
jgi:hypothetical protein